MARFAFRSTLLVAAGLTLGLPAFAHGQQQREEQETPESMRRDSLREIADIKSTFTLTEAAALEEVLAARIVQGFLLVELKQEPEQWPFAVPVKGHPNAVARVTISRKPRDVSEADSPPSRRFTLILDAVEEPDSSLVLSKLHLTAGPFYGQLTLSMDRVWRDGTHTSTQLIQLLAGVENQPPVKLYISRYNAPGQQQDMQTEVTAQAFTELARAEPELFEEFVRPMLQQMGIAPLLESTLRELAVQLFLRQLPVEADVTPKVEQLLVQLDDADFARREAAQQELEKLGRPAATVLANLNDQRQLYPEQATRVRAILMKFQKAEPEQAESRLQDRAFLKSVAALEGQADDPALAELARRKLAELGNEPPATRPSEP